MHHLYRAMRWLGEPLPEDEQHGATLFAPRCVKDRIEEELLRRRRGMFTSLDGSSRTSPMSGLYAIARCVATQ